MSTPFLIALGLVVAALAGVVWSGVAARRQLHYGLILVMFATLAWAIREAEIMGQGLDFGGRAATVRQVHMVAIGTTFLLVPLLAISGVRLARREEAARRAWHKRLAAAFVVAVVLTCALGFVMTAMAEPLAAAPSEGADPPEREPRNA